MTIFWVVGDDWGWLHVLVKPFAHLLGMRCDSSQWKFFACDER